MTRYPFFKLVGQNGWMACLVGSPQGESTRVSLHFVCATGRTGYTVNVCNKSNARKHKLQILNISQKATLSDIASIIKLAIHSECKTYTCITCRPKEWERKECTVHELSTYNLPINYLFTIINTRIIKLHCFCYLYPGVNTTCYA